MRVTETVHVDRLNADPWTAVPSVPRADAGSCVFFTVAPFVEGEVLAAHFGVVLAIRTPGLDDRQGWD